MSIRAVGWLQSKLGLDIGVRGSPGGDDDHALGGDELAGFSTAKNRSHSADPFAVTSSGGDPSLDAGGGAAGTFSELASGLESKLSQVWRQASDKATQYWNNNTRGRARNDAFGANTVAGESPQIDENGLPVTQNWYYYDEQLGRWTVSRDAPESVQREYYEKLQEAERERQGQQTVGLPPPPPPGSATLAGGPPPLLGTSVTTPGGQGPHYALPDYFGTASATLPAQKQQAQLYGVYGSAPSQRAPSAAPVPPPSMPAVGTHPGSYYSTMPNTGTSASATSESFSHGQSPSAHSWVTSVPPPPAPVNPTAVSSISAQTYPAGGSAYTPASAAPTSNPHAGSYQPSVQASPASLQPPPQPQIYPPLAQNDMPASLADPARSQQYGLPFLESQAPAHCCTTPCDNGAAGLSTLAPSSRAGAPAPAQYRSTGPGMYPYSGCNANSKSNIQDSAATVPSASIPVVSQTQFSTSNALQGQSSLQQQQQQQQPQSLSSNPYAYTTPVAPVASARTFPPASAAAEQSLPPRTEGSGYVYPSVASLGTFQSPGAMAEQPRGFELPPPPSFKPFSSS
ncbi:hypothetical protein JKF63_03295 [Porcisia hertigi]|uniref:Uncharacterized protein n=1 Tax=Porcisia hertigi TaxID=2761500 RepID=A0A836HYQ1_9TRYP|nr:hypothetical protein JKF63_03295 [Porcisia hertigi]